MRSVSEATRRSWIPKIRKFVRERGDEHDWDEGMIERFDRMSDEDAYQIIKECNSTNEAGGKLYEHFKRIHDLSADQWFVVDSNETTQNNSWSPYRPVPPIQRSPGWYETLSQKWTERSIPAIVGTIIAILGMMALVAIAIYILIKLLPFLLLAPLVLVSMLGGGPRRGPVYNGAVEADRLMRHAVLRNRFLRSSGIRW